jgi:Ca2+-transporting ATPase
MNEIRPEVPFAMNIMRNAGINVTLVTGDNIVSAKRVAKDSGILRDEDIDGETAKPSSVIEGHEFGKIHEEGKHEDLCESIKVVARCSPDITLLFVQSL